MIALPAGCKPSRACSKDQLRPVLCHAHLRRRDDGLWLEATDSYIAVGLRVGDGEEGWVPVEVLRLIERGAKGLDIEQADEATWCVTDKRGLSDIVSTYTVPDTVSSGKFPDMENIGLYAEPKVARRVEPFGFNPELLAKVGDALGGALRVDFTGSVKPIYLRPINGADDRRAMQMPVRLLEVAPVRAAA